jgi:hypothetical protein
LKKLEFPSPNDNLYEVNISSFCTVVLNKSFKKKFLCVSVSFYLILLLLLFMTVKKIKVKKNAMSKGRSRTPIAWENDI